MSKWRTLIGLLIVAILVIGGYAGYQTYLAPRPPTPNPIPPQGEDSQLPEVISAEGRVQPARFVRLSFAAGGLVEKTFFAKGDSVPANAVLARLEGYERLSAALSAAEMEQLAAQQTLDALYDNADLLSAQAARTLTSARDAARDAERYLDNLTSPAKQTDIEQARANKILSEDALEKAREDFEPYKNKPESNLTRAALQSRLAQIQEQYDAAVRLLNNLLAEVDEIDLAQAETALELANANLTEAQKNYDILQAGPDPDEVALAEARLKNAAAQLAAAQDALEDLELRAPFGGTLVVFEVKEGEFVTPGLPLITLADFSQWQVETIDLAESDVARLEPGMEAIITLDAFPDRTFAGRVIEIAQTAEDRRGDVTYPVTLTFDPGDTPVRWGMTAFVDIALP